MKVKLKFRPCYSHEGIECHETYALVDWSMLESYWEKDGQEIPDRSRLKRYQSQWFIDGRFDPPLLEWDDAQQSVGFSNGRHRAATISKHQSELPVMLCGQSILHPVVHRTVIRILTPDDEVVLPDLEIEERKWGIQ